MVRGSGEGEWCEEGWDSSAVIIQKYFLHNLLINLANLASCSRVVCVLVVTLHRLKKHDL